MIIKSSALQKLKWVGLKKFLNSTLKFVLAGQTVTNVNYEGGIFMENL